MNNIEKKWKTLRDELFQLRLEQRLSRDEESLNKLKVREEELLKKFKKVTAEKVAYEEGKGRKK